MSRDLGVAPEIRLVDVPDWSAGTSPSRAGSVARSRTPAWIGCATVTGWRSSACATGGRDAVAVDSLELAPLVPSLPATFPDARSWSVRMRRALVPLDLADAERLDRELSPLVRSYADALETYADLGRR